MDILFRDFREAQIRGSGPLLASTIKPVAPADNPNQLRAFYYGSNMFSIVSDIRSGILAHSNTDVRFLKPEGNTWADLYVAFWKAIGELLDAEGSTSKAGWVKVYESWKEVANVLIRGYSSAGFQAWTVPCLYVAGQYLRIFAIKADEGAKGSDQDVGFGTAGFQDDVVREFGKNERLEDAARVINRMFTLCISDRYVESIQVYEFSHTSLTEAWSGHRSKSLGNGAFTTRRIYCSKRTSRLALSILYLDEC